MTTAKLLSYTKAHTHTKKKIICTVFSPTDFLQHIAAYFVQKRDIGTVIILDYYL